MEKNEKTEKHMPEKKFKAGAISATIWMNDVQTKNGETSFGTVSLERVYKDKDGSWKTTKAMRINDLPKAALVLSKAYEYLVLSGQDPYALESAY